MGELSPDDLQQVANWAFLPALARLGQLSPSDSSLAWNASIAARLACVLLPLPACLGQQLDYREDFTRR
jgi:hypothetical protein